MVNAVSNSTVPKFTIILGNSYGAGNYAMCGKAYDPRLMLAWPSARVAVMGGAQAAKVLMQIQVASLKKKGEDITEEKEQELFNKIKDRYDKPGDVFLGVIHRPDRPASGVTVFARTSKALERMNVKLHDAISSLAGASGMAVMRAIVAGERETAALLALCDIQIRRAKAEQVKEALRGTWRDEHIFALQQALHSWDHYQHLIAQCDGRIQAVLPAHDPTRPALPGPAKRGGANAPEIAMLREILAQMCGGRDLTKLPALTHYGVLQLVGETGTDLSKWPTEKHFTAWAGLAPGSHDSGKRRGNVKRRRNRTGQLFCMMASALARSKTIALGAFYRRMAARRGGLVANKALARKLAAWYWRIMVKGDDYVERGIANYEDQTRRAKERALRRLAKELGQQLTPVVSPA